MTQLAKLIDKPAEYNFPIETIPMKGICDDKLIGCWDRVMIISNGEKWYLM